MKVFDLYGFRCKDIEEARLSVEQTLKVKMVAHHSLYWGDYYVVDFGTGRSYRLTYNQDPFDEEPAQKEFQDYPILLEVARIELPGEVRAILESAGAFFLKRDVC